VEEGVGVVEERQIFREAPSDRVTCVINDDVNSSGRTDYDLPPHRYPHTLCSTNLAQLAISFKDLSRHPPFTLLHELTKLLRTSFPNLCSLCVLFRNLIRVD
jgi:hypothetical protein